MKNFIITILLLASGISVAQQFNNATIDTVKNKKMLIGYCTREAFQDTAFKDWFDEQYNSYQPDYGILDKLEGKIDNISITIVMGTWCSDSREQVPSFYKILDELNYPTEKIKLICVDRKKKGLSDEADGLNIELVPTIIIYRNNKELGRIIETPQESLEKDLLGIVSK
ncbi:Thioredoxin-like protein [Ignavibacterium album JCM 16511]|uniref:Thioredoxin-like protein n=1 Tax=Ignavibacterium album (strain DSM 19864 / JCM 16511 / NBRC 101810 / Mat9-16) TaxID=945713 RepID=I0AP70_IGNAJ|nr:thioredoxin family protein [Ignavibacterium album]AFH50777.1 Thioredoxin-like protein [Ignavibacterium album JCM 16511]